MNILLNMGVSLTSSLLINSQINPNNNIKTIIIITLVNAIVVPFITTLGIQVKLLLKKWGFKDKEIVIIEITTKKALENKLIETISHLNEEDVTLYNVLVSQLERVRKEIDDLEEILERME